MSSRYRKVPTGDFSPIDDGEDEQPTVEIKVIENGHEETKEKSATPEPELVQIPTLSNILWKTSVNKSVFIHDHEEYVDHFMDFAKLRTLLDNVEANKPNATKEFLEALDVEWNKYQKYAEEEARHINQYPAEKYVLTYILKYNQFVCINQRMLNVLINEFDAISLNDNLCSIWEWKIKWNPQRMTFGLIKKISNLYESERRYSGVNVLDGIDEFSFDRESIKFFVKRSNIMQVISIIIQHLPIYVFGDDQKKSQRVSGQVSSVYFDNDDFKCYEERICKEEGARAFRIRWYGEIEPSNKGDVVYMERKIHHKAMSEEGPSMKERFKMKSGKVISFLNGSIHVPNDSKDAKLQNEWVDAVQQYNLQPKTRTVADRMSFQLSSNNDLRISLDLNLRFYREGNIKNNLWFTPLEQLEDCEFADFEFDILEIKLAGRYTDDPPQWIKDLMETPLLEECYKFSKYGQSVNEFYSDKISITPAWIENVPVLNARDENKAKMTQRQKQNEGVKTYKRAVEGEKVKSKGMSVWRPVCFCTKSERAKKPKSVNPKTYFSNERTFLQWFKSAIFIGGSGLTMRSIDPTSAAGFTMVGVAILVLAWGIVVYYVRNWKLVTGQFEGLHDFYGPGFLGMVLLIVFVYGCFDREFGSAFNP